MMENSHDCDSAVATKGPSWRVKRALFEEREKVQRNGVKLKKISQPPSTQHTAVMG